MINILGITTFNRLDYLQNLIETFKRYTHFDYDKWILIIHNDTIRIDETQVYLEKLQIDNVEIIVLNSDRKGVHAGTNKILQEADKYDFQIGFKVDDDVYFKSINWFVAYLQGIKQYQHLSFFNPLLRNRKYIKNLYKNFQYYTNVYDSQGCFWTFTKEIINKIGYFDIKNMGFRGIGHSNYSKRCCLSGFNEVDTFFDVANSEHLIGIYEQNRCSLPFSTVLEYRKDQSTKIKLTRNLTKSDIYVHFND